MGVDGELDTRGELLHGLGVENHTVVVAGEQDITSLGILNIVVLGNENAFTGGLVVDLEFLAVGKDGVNHAVVAFGEEEDGLVGSGDEVDNLIANDGVFVTGLQADEDVAFVTFVGQFAGEGHRSGGGAELTNDGANHGEVGEGMAKTSAIITRRDLGIVGESMIGLLALALTVVGSGQGISAVVNYIAVGGIVACTVVVLGLGDGKVTVVQQFVTEEVHGVGLQGGLSGELDVDGLVVILGEHVGVLGGEGGVTVVVIQSVHGIGSGTNVVPSPVTIAAASNAESEGLNLRTGDGEVGVGGNHILKAAEAEVLGDNVTGHIADVNLITGHAVVIVTGFALIGHHPTGLVGSTHIVKLGHEAGAGGDNTIVARPAGTGNAQVAVTSGGGSGDIVAHGVIATEDAVAIVEKEHHVAVQTGSLGGETTLAVLVTELGGAIGSSVVEVALEEVVDGGVVVIETALVDNDVIGLARVAGRNINGLANGNSLKGITNGTSGDNSVDAHVVDSNILHIAGEGDGDIHALRNLAIETIVEVRIVDLGSSGSVEEADGDIVDQPAIVTTTSSGAVGTETDLDRGLAAEGEREGHAITDGTKSVQFHINATNVDLGGVPGSTHLIVDILLVLEFLETLDPTNHDGTLVGGGFTLHGGELNVGVDVLGTGLNGIVSQADEHETVVVGVDILQVLNQKTTVPLQKAGVSRAQHADVVGAVGGAGPVAQAGGGAVSHGSDGLTVDLVGGAELAGAAVVDASHVGGGKVEAAQGVVDGILGEDRSLVVNRLLLRPALHHLTKVLSSGAVHRLHELRGLGEGDSGAQSQTQKHKYFFHCV